MSMIDTDAVVIGAGPVGLFAVFALGQVGLSAVVVDVLPEAGGQCAMLYPEKPIYDIPGRTMITGAELVDDLVAQAGAYTPRYLLSCRVQTVTDRDGRLELGLSDGSRIRTGAVVIATGAGAFGPNRPPLDGLEAFEGTSVFYAVRSTERFRGQRVVIAGGGDSAADWSVMLADVAASVSVIHRRRTFRATPATLAQLEQLAAAGKIEVVAPASLSGLEGEGAELRAVLIDDGYGQISRLPADALLCFFGLSKDVSALEDWDIRAGPKGVPVQPDTMVTCRPGVFAIGDIASYPGKLKLILTGFAEAAAAAHAARAHLKPAQAFHFSYSTTRGQPSVLGTRVDH